MDYFDVAEALVDVPPATGPIKQLTPEEVALAEKLARQIVREDATG